MIFELAGDLCRVIEESYCARQVIVERVAPAEPNKRQHLRVRQEPLKLRELFVFGDDFELFAIQAALFQSFA